MSPNNNYLNGVRLERMVVNEWKAKGYEATRSAGSHSSQDVLAWRTDRPVEMTQCKRVKTLAQANRMIETFRSNPPIVPSKYFHQHLVVYVSGDRIYLRAVV